MEITEIIKRSIRYPTTNVKGYFLFGILILLANLKFFTGSTLEHNILIIGIICSLIAFISYCLMSGYDILVIREGINKSNEFPTFDFVKQFVNGIKSIVMAVIFFIIPLAIVICIAFFMNLPEKINEFITTFQTTIMTTSANGTVNVIDPTTIQALPNANSLFTSLGILAIITIILITIFGVFYVIGRCRLAKYDSIKKALNIHESIDDLRKIGIGKFIATYIIMAIIMFLIVFVCELILGVISTLLLGVSLPGIHIVALITFLIINPFIYLFQGQTLGLLYSNAE